MDSDVSTTPAAAKRSRGRGLLWGGVALAVAAILLVVVQYSAELLIVPWYAPLLTTLGAVLLLASLAMRPSVTRVLALALVGLLAGLEWHFLLSASRLPAYAGPVQVGQQMPAFQTTRADGRPFTEANLQEGLRSALVFFRGRW